MKNLIKMIVLIICTTITSSGITLGVVSLIGINFGNKSEKEINLINENYITESIEINRNNEFVAIETFGNPLDDKYMNNISSNQGIREKVTLNNGGVISKDVYHNALDIAVPEGTNVYATKSGIITTVYPSYYNGGAKYYGHPIYGGLVEITHNDGTKTMYAHLSYTIVREGDIVNKGQKIGESGGVVGKRGSGKTTGPHLHYSILMNIDNFITKK